MAVSAAARALLTSTIADFSIQTSFLPPSHHLLIRPNFPLPRKKRSHISCLISGGGGISDEFVSTRKSKFGREFAVIASMLRRIEPLDNSVISKGISDYAKDSMKQTISTMLGLLPSDQFSVTVTVSRDPLVHLIVSSIVTGYTLWNAEYRISLKRNFDITLDSSKGFDLKDKNGMLQGRWKESDNGEEKKRVSGGVEESTEMTMGRFNLQNLHDLSPEALKYIQQLELELSLAKQELHTQKQETLQMEHSRRSNNNLLEYLRSLDSEMVTELSRASSPEVEEIIHELAQSILQRFFNDEIASDPEGDLASSTVENYQDIDDEICHSLCTSRDYLAKLLFWCMLLGHHLRGLENRLHLSCVVGLL